MMASLTNQLRLGVGSWHGDRDKMRAAADRIDELEAAVEEMAAGYAAALMREKGDVLRIEELEAALREIAMNADHWTMSRAREALGEATNDA